MLNVHPKQRLDINEHRCILSLKNDLPRKIPLKETKIQFFTINGEQKFGILLVHNTQNGKQIDNNTDKHVGKCQIGNEKACWVRPKIWATKNRSYNKRVSLIHNLFFMLFYLIF